MQIKKQFKWSRKNAAQKRNKQLSRLMEIDNRQSEENERERIKIKLDNYKRSAWCTLQTANDEERRRRTAAKRFLERFFKVSADCCSTFVVVVSCRVVMERRNKWSAQRPHSYFCISQRLKTETVKELWVFEMITTLMRCSCNFIFFTSLVYCSLAVAVAQWHTLALSTAHSVRDNFAVNCWQRKHWVDAC